MSIRIISQEQEDGTNLDNLDTKIQGNGFYAKFVSNINMIYKKKTNDRQFEIMNGQSSRLQAFNLEDDETISMWMENRDLLCSCPKLKINKKYLIMTKSYSLVQFLRSQSNDVYALNANKTSSSPYMASTNTYSMSTSKLAGILLDRDTFISEWRGPFVRRLRRFMRHHQNGKCDRFNYN